MENSSFETLPQDLQMEILSRLPLKILGKCICVSKKWASLIRGEDFKRFYLSRSMKRPRVMFMARRYTSEPPEPEMWWFHSVYQEQRCDPGSSHDIEALFHSVYQEEKTLLSSGQQQLRIPLEPKGSYISRPVQGLICLQLRTKVAICNPGTKKIRTLPEIQVPEPAHIYTFFGYDETKNVFKVLCITRFGTRELRRFDENTITKYEVCTMGEKSWRPITCKDGHSPETEGLFKGGVLYYAADLYSDSTRVIMSFNVGSEDFSVIELPKGVDFSSIGWNLVNYKGNIALSSCDDYENGVLQLWVRKMGVWLIKIIEIHSWKETVEGLKYYFRGTIGTGELVFTEYFYFENESPYIVLYYDKKAKNLRRFEIEELTEGHCVETFLDHVDSTWLICDEV